MRKTGRIAHFLLCVAARLMSGFEIVACVKIEPQLWLNFSERNQRDEDSVDKEHPR